MDLSGTTETVRAFVAITVPPPLVERLREVQRQLHAKVRGELVRWSKTEQLHLTLKFLGDVATSRLNELKSALGPACEGQVQFQLALDNVGCFPNALKPRVIWIGVSGDVDKLQELQRRVEAQTRNFGDRSDDRDFQPHLTIGRVKAESGRAKAVGDTVEQTRVGRVGEWTVSEVELMQSELSPQGARYTRLSAVRLAQAPSSRRAGGSK